MEKKKHFQPNALVHKPTKRTITKYNLNFKDNGELQVVMISFKLSKVFLDVVKQKTALSPISCVSCYKPLAILSLYEINRDLGLFQGPRRLI